MPSSNEQSGKDDRTFCAMLFEWSARASAIAFGTIVPALIGLGIDLYFRTLPIGIISGAILGCAAGFWQLLELTKDIRK